jgi:uncharacterized protein
VTGEADLGRLLATMRPLLRRGEYVFATAEDVLEGVEPVVTVREAEGVTLVLDRAQADAEGLGYDFVAAMVTLQVHSALDAVGLTAAVAQELTEHGISCNVVAGYFHDHLFVPHERGPEVVELLSALARRHR